MRSITYGAGALLAPGLAMPGFAQEEEISDLCAAASTESAQAVGSSTIKIGDITYTTGQSDE